MGVDVGIRGGKVDFHALRVRGQLVAGYDATSGRVMISRNRGANWRSARPAGTLIDLVLDPASPKRLLAAGESHPFAAGDSGSSWKQCAFVATALAGLLLAAGHADANPDVRAKQGQAEAIVAPVQALAEDVGAAAERFNGANYRLQQLTQKPRTTRLAPARARSLHRSRRTAWLRALSPIHKRRARRARGARACPPTRTPRSSSKCCPTRTPRARSADERRCPR